MKARTRAGAALAAVMLGSLLAACTPTVQMAAPKEPITVNLTSRSSMRST